MNRIYVLIILMTIWSCGADKDKNDESSQEKPVVAAVNYPLYSFAKSIAGENVEVYLPALKGDPIHWKLDTRQVNNFQSADLILANGAGYAKWMEKVSLPSSKIVNTSKGFQDKWIEMDAVTHSHGPEGEHVHKGTASITWLNFDFAIMQAEAIYNSLTKLLPDNSEELSNNFQQLNDALKALDNDMKMMKSQIGEDYLIASHPVYQYLEEAYNLNIISMHWNPGDMPNENDWEGLEKTVQEHHAKIMIWEDKPLQEIQTRLEEIGLKVVVFNPCGNRPETGDFMDMMRKNVERLTEAVKSIKQ
jgi:zinc transport system substrate-binding protein